MIKPSTYEHITDPAVNSHLQCWKLFNIHCIGITDFYDNQWLPIAWRGHRKERTHWRGNWTIWLHAVTTMAFHTCWVAMYSSRIILRIRLTMLPTDACSGSDFVSFLPSAFTSAMRSLQYENKTLEHCGPNIHQYMGIPDGFTTYCAVCQLRCAITSFSKLTVLNAMS